MLGGEMQIRPEMVRSWAEVDLDAYRHNVKELLHHLKHGANLCAIVKADGYGHGAIPVARTALAAGARKLGVVSVREGVALRDASIHAPILLLGPCVREEIPYGIDANMTFSVSSEDEIKCLAACSRAAHQGGRRGRRTKVHILVDTGMGRGGVAPDELWPAAERIVAEQTLELEGVFTHFSSAEELDPEPTREQVLMFRNLLKSLEMRGVTFKVRHCANSAATVFYPESQLDMVRCGALLHGVRMWPQERDDLELRPALSVYTRIVHLGRRPSGWTVGYNRMHRCTRDSILATLPIGYRDGYRRALSGRSEVIVRDTRVPVIGTISMDYVVIDVTSLANGEKGLPEIGERVTLIGSSRDGTERIGVEHLAAMSGTIPYVVTTQLAATVERRYKNASPAVLAGTGLKMALTDRNGSSAVNLTVNEPELQIARRRMKVS